MTLLSHGFMGDKNDDVLTSADLQHSDKMLGLGCIDTKSPSVETEEAVAGLVRKALDLLPRDRIVIHPDCGLRMLPREAVQGQVEGDDLRGTQIQRWKRRNSVRPNDPPSTGGGCGRFPALCASDRPQFLFVVRSRRTEDVNDGTVHIEHLRAMFLPAGKRIMSPGFIRKSLPSRMASSSPESISIICSICSCVWTGK